MQKKWILLPQDPENSFKLAKDLRITPHIAQILLNRGIANPSEFLKPRLSHLKDPFEIPNIIKAAERVISGLQKKEKILVYGDYDVDGVTGTAIILETLQYLGAAPQHYIPYRYNEGYSLNDNAIRKAKEDQVDLIITVDCGISNTKEIKLANSLGIEVIVTDHHNIPPHLPPAHSIVNPKLIKGDHPSKNLSGAGVAFKFVWSLLRLLKKKDNLFLTGLLDLAALGTIADVVPLTEENRILTFAGLNILNKKKRLGIKHLVEAASLSGEISIKHVNFALAPRINAAGRLEHASLSLNLLSAADPNEAQDIAQQLDSINKQRQNIGSKIQKEVFSRIEAEQLYKNKVLIIKGENWHPGVIGIVASQLADKYYRPTILIGTKDGKGRGSARSIEGVNIYEILSAGQDLFPSFGGHEGAAGFEIETKDYEVFCERIQEKANQILVEDFVPHLSIDAELTIPHLTLNFAQELNLLSPFGEGNSVPLFITKEIPLEDFRLVGKEKKHLKAKMGGMDLIGFGWGHMASSLTLSKNYDIVYNLECNEWNGFERVQLNLIDIKESK